MLIETEDDLSVVGEAGDGGEAVRLTRAERPDVVLMDVRMPGVDGIEATRQVADETRVLILTTFDLDEYVYAGLRAGASGFMLKDAPPDELLHAIRVIASGQSLLAASVTTRLISAFASQAQPYRKSEELEGLTEREREVLLLIARGLSNAEICEALHISPATAKTHIGRLLSKLQARDRAQLVIVAYESGLV